MPAQFRPLEQIADDPTVEVGDMLMVRGNIGSEGSQLVPVFYAGLDIYVSDGSAGLKKGKEFPGIRVFHKFDSQGRPQVGEHRASVFYDCHKGLLIPFSGATKNEYALVAKARDIPR
ncbi:hypothetical protein KY360_05730 [Candidatus Woesearchaeota archaeon]|nr:hypothetical protein [Candidatus Woesearchaeota archaeon]